MNNTTQALQLSNITSVFVPLVFLMLVIGLVSNSLLLIVIWKDRKVNNNTNVYLFSLGITGLMRTFIAFTLIVTLIARNWVLGKSICSINQFLSRLITGITSPTILAMNYDRYVSMKHPFLYYKRNRRRTFTTVSLIWIAFSIAGSPAALITVSEIATAPSTIWTECFTSTTLMGNIREIRHILVALNALYFIVIALAIIITIVYFFAIAKELRRMKKTSDSCSLPVTSPLGNIDTVKIRYKPLPIERQATRTLAAFVFFQSTCTVVSAILFIISIVLGVTIPHGRETIAFQLVYTLMLFFFILPAINPFILILKNSKLRNRVKNLIFRKRMTSLYKNRGTSQLESTTINTRSVTVHHISHSTGIFITRSAPVNIPPATPANIYTELGFLPGQIYE